MTVDPTQISKDLGAILELAGSLLTQAVHDAGAKVDGDSLPGGRAMIALAPVGSYLRFNQRVAQAEHDWFTAKDAEGKTGERIDGGVAVLAEHREDFGDWGADEDGTWEPPLQTLRFWSDHYRRILGMNWDHIPTLATEASFLRHKETLDWIVTHEPNVKRFENDVATARRRLENILTAGERSERGVPCMYDECGGVRLVRKLTPTSDKETGQKIWVHSDWHCPRCKRTWDDQSYWKNVEAAYAGVKVEVIGGETWCSVDYAALEVGRSVKTIRTWIARNEVATVAVIAGRRDRYVNLADVRTHDEDSARRAGKSAS